MKILILLSLLMSMNLFASSLGSMLNADVVNRINDPNIIKDYGVCIPFVKGDFEKALSAIEKKHKSLEASYGKFRCNGNKTLLHLYLLNPVKAKNAGEQLEAFFFANPRARDADYRKSMFIYSLTFTVEGLTAIGRINSLLNDSKTSEDDKDELEIIKQRYCDYLGDSDEGC